MKWKLVSKKMIVHSDGHKIELKSGSWRAPMDIHPKIERGLSAVEVARIIREGLEFAYKETASEPTAIHRSDHRKSGF